MTRKTFLTLLLFLFAGLTAQAGWSEDKYSLFVHYGLYSTFGGVYDGQQVRSGYSEQIFSFGVHYMDIYESATEDFTAERFDADSIARLAKRSGMRSVVLTAKHHEGFCLWDTATTDYSSACAPRCGRDLVGEMAEACRRAGLGFGLYFSLIDWHYPAAMPYTSHNADPVTPAHHRYNVQQVTELLTRYGEVDELWFDMGSLTRAQSEELYALVKRLQPDCMVSGRLGNDCADFAVFPDNEIPDYRLDLPWQTAASLFPETWGYRSWQRRGGVEAKVREKLADLIRVVSGGGKYLLNIGPMGDGAVVPFEAKVLERIGELLDEMAPAIYGTKGFYNHDLCITQSADAKRLYLFVPDDRTLVELPPLTERPAVITPLDGEEGVLTQLSGGDRITLRCPSRPGRPYRVVCLTFDQPVALQPAPATPIYAYSAGDYYSGFRSLVGCRHLSQRPMTTIAFIEEYSGREVELNGRPVTLQGDAKELRSTKVTAAGPLRSLSLGGQLGAMPTDKDLVMEPTEGRLIDSTLVGASRLHRGVLLEQELECAEGGALRLDLTYTTGGFLLYLDDEYIDGGYTREASETLPLLLELSPGRHRLTLKLYNAFGTTPQARLTTVERYRLVTMPIEATTDLTIRRPARFPLAQPAHLSALRPYFH